MQRKKIFKKIGKVLLYVVCFVFILCIIAIGFINTKYGKRIITSKIQNYLQSKIKTKVEIGTIDYSLPRHIELQHIYIEDEKKDTLLFGELISIDLKMLKIILGDIDISKIELKNIRANILRNENDSNYNFQFLINAFSGKKTITPEDIKDSTPVNIVLKKLVLNNFHLNYNDKFGGNNFITDIKYFDADINKFQPDKLLFNIEALRTNRFNFSMQIYETINTNKTVSTNSQGSEFWLTAGEVDMKDVNILVENNLDGMLYTNQLKHLVAENIDFDLKAQNITSDNLKLDSSSIQFIAPKPPAKKAEENTTVEKGWTVSLKKLNLINDQFQYDENRLERLKNGFDPSHIFAKNIHANTGNIFYSTDSISANINQLAFTEKSGLILDTTHAIINYNNKEITATELYIKTPNSLIQNSVQLYFNDKSQIINNPQTTTVSAKLSNSTIAINDLYTIMPMVKNYLPVEKFHDNLININTEIKGTLQQLNIPFLQVKGLSGSSIKAKAILYNITNVEKLGYDITIFNSKILKNDLLKFIPHNEYAGELPAEINLNTHIKGNKKNTAFTVNVNSRPLKLIGKIDLQNIDNPKNLTYNVAISEGHVEKGFITKFIPKNTIPSTIQLPQNITFKGFVKGDMNNVEPDLILGGSYGTITAKGYVYNFKNKEAAKYDILFTTQNFEIGKLLLQDSLLGNTTLSVSAQGRGFNYKTMQSNITIKVSDAAIKNYNYKNIDIVAELNGGKIISTGSINDSNLMMRYDAVANLSGKYPTALEATIILDTIQLQKLHLIKDSVNGSFKTYIKADDLNPENLNALVIIDSTRLLVNNKPYLLDSITAKATATNGNNEMVFTSPIADLFAEGKFDYDKISLSVLQFIDKYYDVTSSPSKNLPAQQISVTGEVKKHPLISGLIPSLIYEDISFNGSYTSQGGDSALNLHALIPKFSYQTYAVSKGKIDITSVNNEINYGAVFDTLRINKNKFYASEIKGNLINDSLNITALTKDENKKDQFGIGAAITASNKNYTLSLKDNLLLNYQKWDISPDNKISYSPKGIIVHNFSLQNDQSKIFATTVNNVANSPIDITIENFNIKDIATIANQDTLLVSGIVNGKINVSDFEKKLPAFTGNLTIDELQYQQQAIGNVKFSASNKTENTIAATLGLTGNGNDITAKGNYYLNNEKNQFDADVMIRALNMATLQAMTAGNLVRSSGSTDGDVKLSGTFKEPHWNGSVNFDSAKFTIAKTGAAYSIDKQKIVLRYPDINFSNFVVRDSVRNTMNINGKITAQSISEYDFSLALKSRNFTIVNTPKAIDSQIFGFAAITSNINIAGNMSRPDIEGNITLSNKSDVTIVLPEQNIDKNAARSVVRFIDRDTFELPEKIAFSPLVEQKSSFAQFLNYNLNITVNKNSALTIIVDPSSGDELKVQGDAQLNAGVDPGGNIILAGNYALQSGYYILNYQFLKRQFNLIEGSTIAFSGAPMDAQVDITAEYIANTAAGDLIENEVGQMDVSTATMFNQKIPFRVMMYLKGDIKKPVITFDIQLPDENSNVPISNAMRTTIENKLAQIRRDPGLTNKEVFSLLLMGRFVGEQSTDFFKGNGGSIDDVARQSVSKFLSAALNQITADLFKGIDIDLNLNSYQDFSNGSAQKKTDLNVAVSKNFLNNRLTVTAGKNFGIEGKGDGAKTVQQNTSSLPDITLSYKLSRDGKYMLRAYKREQFEVTVDGYVVETGIAFILTIEYDKFKEIFQKKKKRLKRKKEKND